MSKPLPRRIPSDDCEVTVDGVVYRPHEGEWVEMFSGMSIGEAQSMSKLAKLGVDLQAAQGDEDEAVKVSGLLDEHFDTITSALARRVKAWNWTDDSGEPLHQPDGTPKPLQNLRAEELRWLLMAGQGETPEQRKNA